MKIPAFSAAWNCAKTENWGGCPRILPESNSSHLKIHGWKMNRNLYLYFRGFGLIFKSHYLSVILGEVYKQFKPMLFALRVGVAWPGPSSKKRSLSLESQQKIAWCFSYASHYGNIWLHTHHQSCLKVNKCHKPLTLGFSNKINAQTIDDILNQSCLLDTKWFIPSNHQSEFKRNHRLYLQWGGVRLL